MKNLALYSIYHSTLEGNTTVGFPFVPTALCKIHLHYHTITHTHTHTQCAFLIWCMFPIANNGSVFIYHRVIKPFVKEHEKDFEDAISVGTKLAKEAGKKGMIATLVLHIPTQSLHVWDTNSLHLKRNGSYSSMIRFSPKLTPAYPRWSFKQSNTCHGMISP